MSDLSAESDPLDSMNCEFCRILRREEPARIVCETDGALAFFPLHPAVVGHTLVIPKIHIQDLFALDDATASQLTRAVLHVSRALRNALTPDGLNVITSAGEAASQTVFHLHVHLVPRWLDDHIGKMWPPADPWAEQVTPKVEALVRQACAELAP